MSNKKQISDFQQKILSFYKKHGRDLPWRHTTDRYNILVSEIMLQQTQVSRVVEKYVQWLEKFPTIQRLAKAELSEVLSLWQGLGYNSRGKRLWECAKVIVEKFNGTVPDNPQDLLTLPGIGPYTSRSILIFADNKDIATVDTNIRRIFIHEFNLKKDISDKELFELAEQLLPRSKSRDWHNALMDYGSTILTSKKTGIKPKSTQSKFKGSPRYYRGQILKYCLEHTRGISLAEAKEKYAAQQTLDGNQTTPIISTVLASMVKDELLEEKNNRYIIRKTKA